MESGVTDLVLSSTNGMKRIRDQILGVQIGRKDGAAVLSMMKMHHRVDEVGMFPMMMVSLCSS